MSMDRSMRRIPPPTRTPARLIPLVRKRSSPNSVKMSRMPEAIRVARTATRRCCTRELSFASTAKRAAPLIGLTVTKRAVKEARMKVIIVAPSSADAVALQHSLVQQDSEARLAPRIEPAVARYGTVRPHGLPDGIAGGIGKAFHVGAVADAGEQVPGDLRLLVVGHVHARGGAERGGPTPLGDAPALGGVEVDEVHGSGGQ